MRPNFFRNPRRMMLHVRMEMWGQTMPKRGEYDSSARISYDALEFLSSVDDDSFVLVPCRYVVLDW